MRTLQALERLTFAGVQVSYPLLVRRKKRRAKNITTEKPHRKHLNPKHSFVSNDWVLSGCNKSYRLYHFCIRCMHSDQSLAYANVANSNKEIHRATKLFQCCVTLFSWLDTEHFFFFFALSLSTSSDSYNNTFCFYTPFMYGMCFETNEEIGAGTQDSVCAKEILIFHCVNCNKWGFVRRRILYMLARPLAKSADTSDKFEYLFYILQSDDSPNV